MKKKFNLNGCLYYFVKYNVIFAVLFVIDYLFLKSGNSLVRAVALAIVISFIDIIRVSIKRYKEMTKK